jgi:hypothetical protein
MSPTSCQTAPPRDRINHHQIFIFLSDLGASSTKEAKLYQVSKSLVKHFFALFLFFFVNIL